MVILFSRINKRHELIVQMMEIRNIFTNGILRSFIGYKMQINPEKAIAICVFRDKSKNK